MNSNEDKIYAKTIALNTVYNFVVDFFYLKPFSIKFQNLWTYNNILGL